MRLRIFVTIAALVVFTGAGTMHAGGSACGKVCCIEHHDCCDASACECCGSEAATPTPTKQWSIVNLPEPMLVNRSFVSGPVLIVHDEEKMASGEPCTTIYRYQPGVGPKEALVSFECQPRQGKAVQVTTLTTSKLDGVTCLRSYQLAGDSEIHGVPR